MNVGRKQVLNVGRLSPRMRGAALFVVVVFVVVACVPVGTGPSKPANDPAVAEESSDAKPSEPKPAEAGETSEPKPAEAGETSEPAEPKSEEPAREVGNGRYVVAFVDGTPPEKAMAVLEAAGLGRDRVVLDLAVIGFAVVRAEREQIEHLESQPGIEAVAAEQAAEPTQVNDPFVTSSPGPMTNLGDINVHAAWAQHPGAGGHNPSGPFDGPAIAVIDTGVSDHEEFHPLGTSTPIPNAKVPVCTWSVTWLNCDDQYVLWDGFLTFTSLTHGTHVAGIAAAVTDNGLGIAGISGRSPVHNYKVCTFICLFGDIAWAIVTAAQSGVEVINLSLGWAGPDIEPANLDLLEEAVAFAIANDVVVAVSAGNSNNSVFRYPTAFQGAVSVGATNTGETTKAWFSSYNNQVDLAAPGTDIISAQGTNIDPAYADPSGYLKMSGTSMAAPHVSGVAALVRDAHPSWTAGRTKLALFESALDIGAPGRDPEFGHGRLDAAAALNHATPPGSDPDGDGVASYWDADEYDPERWNLDHMSGYAEVGPVSVRVETVLGGPFADSYTIEIENAHYRFRSMNWTFGPNGFTDLGTAVNGVTLTGGASC